MQTENVSCGDCGGGGVVDSGGVNPDMTPISLPCPTCSQQINEQIGKMWRENSSLEKWFPMTAALMKVNEATIKRQQERISELQGIICELTNRNKN